MYSVCGWHIFRVWWENGAWLRLELNLIKKKNLTHHMSSFSPKQIPDSAHLDLTTSCLFHKHEPKLMLSWRERDNQMAMTMEHGELALMFSIDCHKRVMLEYECEQVLHL